MKNILKIAAAIAVLGATPTHADVTLSYQLSGPDMEDQTKIFSLARFFARIDDPAAPDPYLLYQAGKFFPLYQVSKSTSSFTRLTPEVKPTLHAAMSPKLDTAQEKPLAKTGKTAPTEDTTPAETALTESTKTTGTAHAHLEKTEPAVSTAAEQSTKGKAADSNEKTAEVKKSTSLRLTKKTKKIAGIDCRIIEELAGDQPIMTHCMADKVRLGITERELRSLGRLFKMARELNYGWLGTATSDETFVSVASEDLQSKKTLQLISLSTKPLPTGYLRIPRNFKQVQQK